MTSTFSCINYTLNSFGFLVQMTLFRVINFLIYKEWKRGGNTLSNMCIPDQNPIQISALCFGLAGGTVWADKRKPWGAGSAPKADELLTAGSRRHSACFPSLGHDEGFQHPHLVCELHIYQAPAPPECSQSPMTPLQTKKPWLTEGTQCIQSHLDAKKWSRDAHPGFDLGSSD